MWLPEEMRQRLAGQPAGGALLHLHPPGSQATLPVPSDMRPGFATQGGAEQQRGTDERLPLPLNGGYIPLGPGLSPLPAAGQAQVSAGGQGIAPASYGIAGARRSRALVRAGPPAPRGKPSPRALYASVNEIGGGASMPHRANMAGGRELLLDYHRCATYGH
ncbi:hypothetical protein T492DRAFT_534961 [Pavlovales sp. CCMP2436]|nr:hypothetical protein T492DRAFT_534961 [Pavlovales sp. CCMP2436]